MGSRWYKWLFPNCFLWIFAYLIYTPKIFRWGEFEWTGWDFLQAWVQIQLQEFLYYWLHRAQHANKQFYKIHKQHHSVRVPRALSFPVHGVVDTWFNFLVTFAGPLFIWWGTGLRIHAWSNIGVWTWNLLAGAETHSGFWYAPITDLTFLPVDVLLNKNLPVIGFLGKVLGTDKPLFDHSVAHYFHHTVNTGNYGHWMDCVFGTDKAYMKWRVRKGIDRADAGEVGKEMVGKDEEDGDIGYTDVNAGKGNDVDKEE